MSDLRSFDDAGFGPLLDQLSDGVAVALPESWRLSYASPTLAGWLGKAADELRDTPLEKLFRPESRAEVLALAGRVCEGSLPSAVMTGELQTEDVRFGAVEVRLCRIVLGEQLRLGVVIRRRSQEMDATTASAARRDPLTGLPDREFLFDRLAASLRGARAADRRFALLFLDLDNFKQVNDSHGHLIGDSVLREVARRLQGCVRDGDHVVRFGGDEFVVLLEGIAGPKEIEPVVRRIQAALANPIALPEGEFTLSLSIGVAEASPDHHSPEDLLQAADRAMYAAKRHP